MLDFVAFTFAAIVRLEPSMIVREAEATELADAIAKVSTSERDVSDLVALAYWESGRSFDCSLTGDHGHSVSCFGLWACPGPHCLPSIVDIEYAAREALVRIRASEARCSCLSGGDVWSEYTTGKCQTNREARVRWMTARWLERNAVPSPS